MGARQSNDSSHGSSGSGAQASTPQATSSARPRASSLRHDRSHDSHFSEADELIRALRNARLLSLSSSDSYEQAGGGGDDEAGTSQGGSGSRNRNSTTARRRPHNSRRSVPLFMMVTDLKCPVCQKVVPSDEADLHIVMCLTRPKITYNDDVLTEDKGECAICLEDMQQGDTIARLPCLCVYHKHCIDDWFSRKNSCPEHPGD